MIANRLRAVAAFGMTLGLALGGSRPALAQFVGFASLRQGVDEAQVATAASNGSIAVETPEKDGLKVYSIEEGTWSEYRAPKGVRVRPIAGGNYIAAIPEGPKITQLAAFSEASKGWITLDLPVPAEGQLWGPVISPNTAAYVDGRRVYAFSASAAKWGVLELPEGAEPRPLVSPKVATVAHDGRLYIFNAKFGRWDDSGQKPIVADRPKRGALRIAKLRHAGDWNIAPLAIPNLTTALRDKLRFDVVINHKELFARDPSLVHYPLIYLHGRAEVEFSEEDRLALRRHLSPGGGTLFADAACGSASFDAAFRRLAAELMPGTPLVAIPRDDDFYARRLGYDLADAKRTPAAGGRADYPELEGIKVDGRWAIIYSKYDLGSAIQTPANLDDKGYTHESALRIATNVVIYSTLP